MMTGAGRKLSKAMFGPGKGNKNPTFPVGPNYSEVGGLQELDILAKGKQNTIVKMFRG